MVPLTMGDLPEGGQEVLDKEENPIAIGCEESSPILGEFCAPKGLQAIVVLRAGLWTFLSEQNVPVPEGGK